jgi:hypothetical protein
MRSMGAIIRSLLAAAGLMVFHEPYADEVIDDSNCMSYLGGGGFGDFDCLERHARRLEAENRKISEQIGSMRGVTSENRAELDEYMRAQDQAIAHCDLPDKLARVLGTRGTSEDHIDLYDVMAMRCRYYSRKQQNDFLQDVYSLRSEASADVRRI